MHRRSAKRENTTVEHIAVDFHPRFLGTQKRKQTKTLVGVDTRVIVTGIWNSYNGLFLLEISVNYGRCHFQLSDSQVFHICLFQCLPSV